MREQNADVKNNTSSVQAGLINITYYTDPLCCWSWAFECERQKLVADFENKISWRYCMGGLLPAWNNYHDAINSISRPLQMGPMWMHAAELTGATIRNDIWANDPPASSYPACIAVKCAALQSLAAEEKYLFLVREACMVDGKNIAKADVLFEVAKAVSVDGNIEFDVKLFKQHLFSNEGREAFRKDLQEVKYRGINRFPSLLIRYNNYAKLITGYQPLETIANSLNELIKKSPGISA